jgi:hypothetical protein
MTRAASLGYHMKKDEPLMLPITNSNPRTSRSNPLNIVAKTRSRPAASVVISCATAGGERRLSLISAGPLGNRNLVQCAEIGFELRGRVRKSIRL